MVTFETHVAYTYTRDSRLPSRVYDPHAARCTLHFAPYSVRHGTTLLECIRPYTLYAAFCKLHPTPCTLHPTAWKAQETWRFPTPYTLHPAPCTLPPTPWQVQETRRIMGPLHPEPCTLPPVPYPLESARDLEDHGSAGNKGGHHVLPNRNFCAHERSGSDKRSGSTRDPDLSRAPTRDQGRNFCAHERSGSVILQQDSNHVLPNADVCTHTK